MKTKRRHSSIASGVRHGAFVFDLVYDKIAIIDTIRGVAE